jgi:hypothetical protein
MLVRCLPTALLSAIACSGCAGVHTETDLHAVFARIQVDEARIEHAEAGLGPETPCEDREAACAALCDAAGDVCAIAEPLGDRDAAARCERARARCAACRSEHRSRCAGARL